VPYGQEVDIWSLGVLFFYLLFGEFPFKGINILDDIHSKCKTGFKLSENVKPKTYFKSRKEELALNDLFKKIFEIDVHRRVTITSLKEHPALKTRTVE
jgi:serine/threonine protein kinase